MLEIGDIAPPFELLSADNQSVNLATYLGKRVILFFYPKAGTPGCTDQACGFREQWPTIEANDATVIGISPDQPSALAKWQAEEQFPYTLLSDPDHATAESYGVWGEKKMYGKPYMGIVRSHFVISADGIVEQVAYKVSPADSVRKSVAFLKKGSE